MKILLAVIGVVLSGVLAEPEAPYPPSGFRPNGPAFELPQKNTQSQEYLPPVEPRRPIQIPNNQYGPPEEEDVSVQGLPAQEQQPIFQVSPVNGQLYVGPQFNTDLRSLDSQDSFRFNQYQLQQEKYRELERQRQLDAAQARTRNNQVPSPQNPQVPRQFAQPAPTTTESTFSTKNIDESETSTPAIELNEGETFEESNRNDDKNKVTVEVSRQKLQEYPGELFLSSLAQLQLQPQFVPIQQFGQLNAPLQYQPIQQEPQQVGYDARTHFAALPSVLSQRQSLQPQNQQGFLQNPALFVASQDPSVAALVQAQQAPNQYQPFVNNQYQPLQPQVFPQTMTVPPPLQSYQPNFQSQQPENDESRQEQDQTFYQQSYQPQEVVYQYQQSQPIAPNQQQEQQNYPLPQAHLVNYPQLVQQYQNGYNPQQFAGQQQAFQGQDNLQSGLDVNQQGNGVDDTEDRNADDENRDDDGSMAVAVATAFGARTQPRVLTRYGAPIPRVTADSQPVQQASQDEDDSGNAPVVAQANAFATGRRKSAQLRSRRVGPTFTLDRSGHLVLAQEQN